MRAAVDLDRIGADLGALLTMNAREVAGPVRDVDRRPTRYGRSRVRAGSRMGCLTRTGWNLAINLGRSVVASGLWRKCLLIWDDVVSVVPLGGTIEVTSQC